MELYLYETTDPTRTLESRFQQDGPLYCNLLSSGRPVAFIERKCGFLNNAKQLETIFAVRPHAVIVSDDETLLAHSDLFWDPATNSFDIWFMRHGRPIRTQDACDRELRLSHNIEKLWRAGMFEKKTIKKENQK